MSRSTAVLLALALVGCDQPPPPPAPLVPTPTPVSQEEMDRQVRARTAELDRALEQQLANRRAQGDGQRLQVDIQERLAREIEKRRTGQPTPVTGK